MKKVEVRNSVFFNAFCIRIADEKVIIFITTFYLTEILYKKEIAAYADATPAAAKIRQSAFVLRHSTRATHMAAIPCPFPMIPRPSVVVALILTQPGSMVTAAARFSCILSR